MLRKLLAALLTCASPAIAGPEWIEGSDDDAGPLPDSAQRTIGETPITLIGGCLAGLGCGGTLNGDVSDFQDMYVIRIYDPMSFCATTVGPVAEAGFDTVLYLFDISGVGLLGNDDTPIVSLDGLVESGSTLGNASNDGTGVVLTEPGLYLLAITVVPNGPIDENGDPIFIFEGKGEVSGPERGAGPITGWVERTGACCFYGGPGIEPTCSVLLETECLEQGGEYNGDDTDCDGADPCPLPTGACCFSDNGEDGCAVVTADDCGLIGGVYLGDDTECGAEGECPVPTGACCFGGHFCEVVPENECTGVFYGDGVPCDGRLCPQPVGACCIEAGGGSSCVLMSEDECAADGGLYYGDFVPCAPQNQCPTGACCLPKGVCMELTPFLCGELGGMYEGDFTTCDFPACGEDVCVAGAGACNVPNGTPGCDDASCCEAVCASDPFCCDVEWDAMCASAAIDICTIGPGGDPPGPPVNGLYTIALCGVRPASTDCDDNDVADDVQTAPDFDPNDLDPVAEDLCSDAQWICPGAYDGTSVGAQSGDVLVCGSYFGVYDVFYKYRAKYDGPADVSVDGTSSNWLISVHTACPATDANRIACSNPTPGTVTFDAERGRTYWIRTAAINFASGLGPFTLSLVGPDCAPSAVDLNANGRPDVCDCPTDVAPPKPDGMTNLADYIAVLAAFGPCDGCPEDVDQSGVVDAADLQLVLVALNQACPGTVPASSPIGETP